MTNQNDQGKGKTDAGADKLQGGHKTRSLSLREALAALDEGGDAAAPHDSPVSQGTPVSEGNVAAGVESIMNDKIKQTPLASPKAMAPKAEPDAQAETGKPKTKVFGGSDEELKYYQEPVVGWLVIVGGPGIGAHRPIFMGSNTIGSDPGQRIPIDFGDDYISKEEQAYIRYDADDRQFLFIPNLAKTNVVSIDNVKPTSAVRLMPYDIISMGSTQLVFIPFCGEEFDWSDLPVHQK